MKPVKPGAGRRFVRLSVDKITDFGLSIADFGFGFNNN